MPVCGYDHDPATGLNTLTCDLGGVESQCANGFGFSAWAVSSPNDGGTPVVFGYCSANGASARFDEMVETMVPSGFEAFCCKLDPGVDFDKLAVLEVNGSSRDDRLSGRFVDGASNITELGTSIPALTGVLYSYLKGGDGADTIEGSWVTNLAFHEELDGGLQGDHIHGRAGDDVLRGGPDDVQDHLSGEGGNDTIFGGPGGDSISGGSGWDTLYGEDGEDIINGGDGRDTIYGGRGNDLALSGGNDIDHIYGGWGNDILYGGNQADHLFGDRGDDELYGGDQADQLHGGLGNDQLYGGHGNDVLYGGMGSDLLDGGPQNDILCDTRRYIVKGVDRCLNTTFDIRGESGVDKVWIEHPGAGPCALADFPLDLGTHSVGTGYDSVMSNAQGGGIMNLIAPTLFPNGGILPACDTIRLEGGVY